MASLFKNILHSFRNIFVPSYVRVGQSSEVITAAEL